MDVVCLSLVELGVHYLRQNAITTETFLPLATKQGRYMQSCCILSFLTPHPPANTPPLPPAH